MRFTSLLCMLLMLKAQLAAQSLFVSKDIQKAYQHGTRSPDGKPGKNYWQNKASYTIQISALPPDRNIKGTETIVYSNNSPDSLRFLIIKLFQNEHKPTAPRDFGVSPDYLTAGITINSVYINGNRKEWKGTENFYTAERLDLDKPLAPGSSIELKIDWHYEIAKRSGREGMIDSTAWFLAYFFPRIAVYDDYNQWDDIAFTGSREFYNDFCDFDVTVKVPANYIVWGTGTLQQPEKLLQPQIVQRFKQSLLTNEVIHIASLPDIKNKNVTLQNNINEWRFISNNIPDVAFGISDHYVWDGCSVVVDDVTGRRASAQAAYKDEAADYHHVARYAQHSLDWFSHHWPGVAYPYEKTTIFQGFADMEYPMMANNSSFEDTTFSRFVAEHEIAHTYMPFYMGINETRYGFMDEGWATAFEYLVGIEDLGLKSATEMFKRFRVNRWTRSNNPNQTIPIITPADGLTVNAFGNNIYGKPALGYLAVKDMLGDELFKQCLQEYMHRWKGKHPAPWDFFYTFNEVSKKDLNWFWKQWFFEASYIDYALQQVTSKGNRYTFNIENKGGMTAPMDVILQYKDGSSDTFHQTPAIWEKSQTSISVTVTAAKEVAKITLDGGIFMDANEKDNSWEKK